MGMTSTPHCHFWVDQTEDLQVYHLSVLWSRQTTYLEIEPSLIGIRCSLVQNPEEKGNEQGQYSVFMHTSSHIWTIWNQQHVLANY